MFTKLLAMIAALSFASTLYAQWRFVPLGDVPGGAFESAARAISDNGVVVGWCSTPSGRQGMRWTEQAGAAAVPGSSVIADVSADGSVLVSLNGRWTSQTGWVPFPPVVYNAGCAFPACTGTFAWTEVNACSGDGRTVVGAARACRIPAIWREGLGSSTLVVNPGSYYFCNTGGMSDSLTFRAISTDGNWALLSHDTFVAKSSRARLYRFDVRTGGVTGAPGLAYGSGYGALSFDGSVYVGWYPQFCPSFCVPGGFQRVDMSSGQRTPVGTLVPFGQNTVPFATARADMSDDGTLIAGTCLTTGFADTAFLWTQSMGTRELLPFLLERNTRGLDGWTLDNAHAVSRNGRFIAGQGINPQGAREGWVVVVGSPCADTDFNNDGVWPDSADTEALLQALSGGPCTTNLCDSTDFNGDGISPDSRDIEDFLRVLAGGAC